MGKAFLHTEIQHDGQLKACGREEEKKEESSVLNSLRYGLLWLLIQIQMPPPIICMDPHFCNNLLQTPTFTPFWHISEAMIYELKIILCLSSLMPVVLPLGMKKRTEFPPKSLLALCCWLKQVEWETRLKAQFFHLNFGTLILVLPGLQQITQVSHVSASLPLKWEYWFQVFLMYFIVHGHKTLQREESFTIFLCLDFLTQINSINCQHYL